ncbi:sigma factor G inhibitor Gin [Bacillus sp. CECT 9360]|uniref:sigma factor G inhibitor Gin n=1 Tax=Bacillus sp. CECT 9360 TaxID=2845821 RepID=UPI001E61F2FC|nr:sigma factor G inhibitor Gin [Bacillus sp. CECT 9360]CAH0347554.1 Anti-sigma-G factor Gin [Bacillus sp. CECT 9360]
MLNSTAAKKFVGETCVVCEEIKLAGIHLYTAFICEECERDIIHTDTNNPQYKYYLKQLKKVNNPEIYS